MLALAAAGLLALGGGTAPTGVHGYRGQLTIVSLHRGAPGSVVVRALVQARCGAGQIKRRVPLAADGTFAVDTTERDRAPEYPGVRRIADVQISGRIAGAVAAGTAATRVRLERRGRRVGRCRSGSRTWQARTAVAQTAPGPPRARRGYFGLTAQARRPHAFMLHVDAAARRVQAAVFDYALECRGRRLELANVTPGGRIGADGRFSLRERFTAAAARYRVQVDGRFTPAGVSGTLSVVRGDCRTGPVTFAGGL
jgi:hypothetical protein